MMQPPLVILAEMPDTRRMIVGDWNGEAWEIDEDISFPPNWITRPIRVDYTLSTVRLPLDTDGNPWLPDVEKVEIKWAVFGKHAIRCGFGPQSHKWVVQGAPVTAAGRAAAEGEEA